MKNKIKNLPHAERLIHSKKSPGEEGKLSISFVNFNANCICISSFNNHYKDENDYIKKISSLFSCFKTVCGFDSAQLGSNGRLREMWHIHQIEDTKLQLIKNILRKYDFSDDQISSILEGEQLYQMECYGSGGAVRIVYQLIDNTIYPYFFDNNHHIYLNTSKCGESENNTYCPLTHQSCTASIDENYTLEIDGCAISEFIDKEAYSKSFNYTFTVE